MAGYGLKLAKTFGSTPTAQSLGEFPINPSNTDKMSHGDLVKLNAGYIEELADNSAGNIAETKYPFGVFMGCRYVANGDYHFMPSYDGVAGKTEVYATIVPLQGRLFRVKGDSGITWALADIGTTRRLIWAAPSVGRLGESRVTLGASSAVGHARIVALESTPNNGYTAAGVTEPVFLVEIVRTQTGLAVPYTTT